MTCSHFIQTLLVFYSEKDPSTELFPFEKIPLRSQSHTDDSKKLRLVLPLETLAASIAPKA
jgi:hypothetical protein